MHLIQDENGNPCPHGHGHEHPCPNACEHTHEVPQGDKMTAVLDYMHRHNEHHAAELDQVAGQLRSAGKEAAAEQIKKAVDEFQKGNLYLSLALSMMRENGCGSDENQCGEKT